MEKSAHLNYTKCLETDIKCLRAFFPRKMTLRIVLLHFYLNNFILHYITILYYKEKKLSKNINY